MRNTLVGIVAAIALLTLSGCETSVPPQALALQPQTLQMRQAQSRRFETSDEKKMLRACAGLLQDLGFTIEESASDLGLVVASKDRSAVETGQVITAMFLGAPYDRFQRFRASVVTRLTEEGKSVVVRVTFQRTVWNTEKQITHNEPLNKPELYQQFFQKLSQAVFLEANDL